jgi:uncharacterized surface protein with fasciclin (FAS1) repeats
LITNYKKFNMKISKLTLSLILIMVSIITACDKRETPFIRPSTVTNNIVEEAAAQGYNVFVAAVKATGMDTAFDYLGQYTVLVPTDAAFAAAGINAGNLNTLPKDMLRTVLRNHILAGRSPSANLLLGPNAVYGNINRDYLYTTTYVASVAGPFAGTYFNGARVTKVDMICNNGLLHEVNKVLFPASGNLTATLAANPNLSFLLAAINRAGLAASLNGAITNINLLAPTNAAFQAAGFATIDAINAADPAVLVPILGLHVIPASVASANPGATGGRLFSPDFRARTYNTLLGAPLTVTLSGTSPRFAGAGNGANSAQVTSADIHFRTSVQRPQGPPVSAPGTAPVGAPSVMHIIDRVLLP